MFLTNSRSGLSRWSPEVRILLILSLHGCLSRHCVSDSYRGVVRFRLIIPILAPFIRQNATVRGALPVWEIEMPLQSCHLDVWCSSWIEDPRTSTS